MYVYNIYFCPNIKCMVIRNIICSFLLFMMLHPFGSMAQEAGKCGVIDQSALVERLNANREFRKANPELFKSLEEIYIPIKFHLLANFDGTERIKKSSVLDQLCKLNRDFGIYDMHFYLKSDTEGNFFDEIDHSGVFNDPRTQNAVNVILANKDGNAVDVFVINDAGSSGNVVSAGYYTSFGDYIVAEKAQLVDTNNTVSHEMGHYFTLPHPHRGWEDDPWDPDVHGDTVLVTMVGSAQTGGAINVELMDGSNCLNSGDNICDTPPDYNFGVTSPGCNFIYKVWDRNFEQIEMEPDNMMSYFFTCVPFKFTPDQVTAMNNDFMSNARNHIRSSYIPNLDDVTGNIVINAPANGSTTEYSNSVYLDWDPVQGATHYLVEITSQTNDVFEYITEDTELLVTELEENLFHFWIVHPFNESSACLKSPANAFKTGTGVTSVNDIADLSSFTIFPNPIESGQDLSLTFDATSVFTATIQLRSIEGKVVTGQNNVVPNGKSRITIPVTDATPGMYILSITNGQEVAVRKVIIE